MNIFHAGLYGYLLLILFLAVSFSVSFLFYRKSGTDGFRKAVLVLLRTASLFLILSLLTNPFITYRTDSSKKAKDIILIDNSLSLNLEKRFEKLPDALNEIEKLSSDHSVYAFGSGLLNEIKNNKECYSGSEYRTYSTDLTAAFEELYRIYGNTGINSVTVISDGIINGNGSPVVAAKKLEAPVYYYLIGDTVQKSDVLIKKIFYNRSAFAGSVSTIRVLVNSFGYSKNLNVSLYEEGILKQTKNILTNLQENEYSAEFKITSGIAGITKYTVKIDTLENEITALNNKKDFFIKYTGNKFKTLVIAGSPGADFSAFRQSLAGFENFSADFLIGKSPDAFYEGEIPALKSYDALFLFGFPLANTNKNLTDKIVSDAASNNIPVVFFNTSNTGYENLKAMESILPFTVNGASGSPYLSPSRLLPFNMPEEPEPIRKINILPPVSFSKGAFSPKPGANVLGVTNTENEPAIILYNDGKSGSAAFLGFGVYKWTLNNSRESDNVLKNLTAVLFNLVLDGNRGNKFFLSTEKDCYAFSEPVQIIAVDGTGNTGNTSVRLKLSGKNFSRETEMERNDASSFMYSFIPDSVSDYTAAGMLFSDKQLLAEDVLRFSCGGPGDEYLLTKADAEILKSISANTGGTNIKEYPKSSFEKRKIKEGPVFIENKFLLRDSVYWLLLIIFLLSAEWFLRKRFNIP